MDAMTSILTGRTVTRRRAARRSGRARGPFRAYRQRGDSGQSALILVLVVSIVLTTTGAVLVGTAISNDPLLQTQSVQQYAYRALEAGINSYLTAINTNPGLAQCSSATNGTGTCSGLNYDSWNLVSGSNQNTNGGTNASEYYAFGNPQPVFNTSNGALDHITVDVAGAAYDPNAAHHYAFESQTISVTPSNGFLDHVWWSNFESYNANGNYTGCMYNWKANYNIDNSNMPCTPVYFGGADYLNGPVYTNDSVFVYPTPSFGSSSAPTSVQTADPNCLFVADVNPSVTQYVNDGMTGGTGSCSQVANTSNGWVGAYDASTSSYGHAIEQPPKDDSQLATIAAQNGCLYTGPTQITLGVDASGHGTMTVSSPETTEKSVTSGSNTYTWDTANISTNLNQCPNDGTAPLPSNGVVFVQNATSSQSVAWANPFDAPYSTTYTNVTQSPSPYTTSASMTLTATEYPGDGGGTMKFTETQMVQTCYYKWIRGRGRVWTCTLTPQTSTISGCSAQSLTQAPNVNGYAAYQATCTFTAPSTTGATFSAIYSGDSNYGKSTGKVGTTKLGTPTKTYGPDSQVAAGGCSGCYYGETATPDTEGDAFVHGNLSGQLTIGTANNLIIDGNVTYNDCTWTTGYGSTTAGTASESYCGYNKNGTNDALGLIANNYAEVNHPVDHSGNPLGHCTTPGPLCDPSDSSGNLTIDAAVLALNQSFVVNNYTQGSQEGHLIVYGSIQQYARGPVGLIGASGYTKHYTWDPLLDYVSPPSYLVPSMPSWQLGSSAAATVEPNTGGCPSMPAPYGSTSGASTSYCATAVNSPASALPNYG